MATPSNPPATSPNNVRFDAEAANWDSNAFVQAATTAAYKALKQTLPILNQGPEKTSSILEIGCGTGLLSLLTARDVQSQTSVDASRGMISVFQSKLSASAAPSNIQAICALLEDGEDAALPPANPSEPAGPRKKFDLVTSHLVLHHVEHLAPLLATMFACLRPGGEVALTDFEDFGPEAKKFHPASKLKGVERHGIPRAWMAGLIRDAGFVDVDVGVAWTMMKEVERFDGEFGSKPSGAEGEGTMMEFPFLICRGRKP